MKAPTYALSLGWNMSLMVPPPFAIPTPRFQCQRLIWNTDVKNLMKRGVLPKNPLIALTAIRLSTFGLSAVGICRRAKIEKQTKYSFLLPKVSDSGARMRGPRPRKTTKPVVAPTTTSLEVPRSAAISSMPGVNILDASGERTG